MKTTLGRTSRQLLILGAVMLGAFAPLPALAQLITTYAGGATPIDGAQATTQSFDAVNSVLSDRFGGFYLSSSGSDQHRVYRVSSNGVLTIIAGTGAPGFSGDGGPALSAQLSDPDGLALDASGNLFIADRGNNRIRKVTPAGIISTFAGAGGGGGFSGDGGPAISARLNYPTDVAVDFTGAVLIADRFNNRIRKVSTSGTITTVAGSGSSGFSGDRGPAISARIANPYGVAVDATGNIFIADSGNNRVRQVTPDGTITTVAGNGGTPNGLINVPALSIGIGFPTGVTIDANGALIIAESSSNRIRRVNSAGIITTIAGTPTGGGFSGDGGAATSARLLTPRRVSTDFSGNLFINDSTNRRVRKVNSAGIISTVAGTGTYGDGGAAIRATFDYPNSLGMDSAGNLYVADTQHALIRKISALGIVSTLFTANFGATAIAVDASDNVYFSDCTNSVYRATPAGVVSVFVPANIRWEFCGYYSYYASDVRGALAFDTSENLLVAGTYTNRIEKRAPDGTLSTVAGTGAFNFGGDGGPATNASFRYPWGIAFDSAGNLFVVDTFNNRIRRITPGGVITTVAGTGSSGFTGDGGLAIAAQLASPSAVVVDAAGNLYFSDTDNHRIRKVTPDGIISTIAGNGHATYGGDGGLATLSQLQYPTALALDAVGNLFIADSGNHRIRRIGFALTTPTLVSASTNIGVTGQSTQVTFSGTSFSSPLTIDAGSGVTVTNVTVVNELLATATLTVDPSATLGARNVTLTTNLGVTGSLPFTVVPPSPDLTIRSTHVGNFGVGFDATYIVAVSNQGPVATTGPITMTDELPAGLTYRSGTGDGWSCSSVDRLVTCVNPDALSPGASTTLNLTVGVGAAAASNIIHAPKVATEGDIATANDAAQDNTVVAVPVVHVRFTPLSIVAGDQATVDLTLPFAFPYEVTGTLNLEFSPDAINPADDPAIQFASGGRTIAFTIPPNTVQARFGASGPGPIGFQAGTVSGNLSLRGMLQTGDVQTAFSGTANIPKQAPKIASVEREAVSGNNFTLGVHLLSSSREVTQLVIQLTSSQRLRLSCGAVAGCTASGNSLTLDVKSMFDTWFVADALHGSVSTLHLPFAIDRSIQGAIVINVTNRFGASNSVSYTLP